MTKSIHFLLVITLGLWVISPGFAAEAPNTNSTPSPPSSLNPTWKEFLAPPLVPGELPDAHRVQFGKQNCQDCHKRETPKMYQQWLGSKHGLNDVKCGICHGDANNYRAQPDKNICIGCHSQQINNMPQDALVTNCSFCHKAHWYTVHKIKLYEKFLPGREKRFKVPGF